MPSSLFELNNAWVVGVCTGVIVIVAQWLFATRVERQIWRSARESFAIQILEHADNFTRAFSKNLNLEEDMLFLEDGLGEALTYVVEVNQRYLACVSINSRALTARLAADISAVTDKLRIASFSAQKAAAMWPKLKRDTLAKDHRFELSHFTVGQIARSKASVLFTGTSDDLHWKQFGKELLSCCDNVALASVILCKLVRDNASERSLKEAKHKEDRDLDLVEGQGSLIRDCARHIDEGKLNTLRREWRSEAA